MSMKLLDVVACLGVRVRPYIGVLDLGFLYRGQSNSSIYYLDVSSEIVFVT